VIQPARGYNIDPKSTYHDPALVPPHSYFAAYAWLADDFRCDAVIHLGKHGTLEWLPGKALALSAECFPESVLAPLPHLYPFIVNDPGEGTQAKRRAQAVIVDHLTPPLARAGGYGALAELERLIDEYYEAAHGDFRRVAVLAAAILEQARAAGLDGDCGITGEDDQASALRKLDGFLCELKELQIRDGLHVLGSSPRAEQLAALLLAFARAGRGAAPEDAPLLRALAADLDLGEDPLASDLAEPWSGPRPAVLAGAGLWRSVGDTVERLETLALRLVTGEARSEPSWLRTQAVLDWIERQLRPSVAGCGEAELAGLLAGLDGRAEPRPPRRIADRPQFLLGRHPRDADSGGLAARLGIGGNVARAPCPGIRQLPSAGRAIGLGYGEHAHWRRRRCPGAGAHGRAAGMGTVEWAGERVRDHAGIGARSAPGRCHVARLRLLPRRVSGADRSRRRGGPRRRSAGRTTGDQPACRPSQS